MIQENEKSFYSGLQFRNTPAAAADIELARLAEIEDSATRTRDTLAYLKTLPEWPLPLGSEKPTPKKPAPKEKAQQAPTREDISKLRQEIQALQNNLGERNDELAQAGNQISDLGEALQTARNRLKAFEADTAERIDRANAAFSDSMKAAEEAFSESLATSEPVKLWKDKQGEHETSRDSAYRLFQKSLGAIILAVIALLIILTISPAATDALLGPAGCNPKIPETCKGFGFRGLIVTASTLTVLTVLLWFTRLQMKLYLAERHMAIDARERQAFAQTYLGFLKEGDTSEDAKEQRGMVYAALFRPSSDGTIKEEGGLDPAITAAISKLLTKEPQKRDRASAGQAAPPEALWAMRYMEIQMARLTGLEPATSGVTGRHSNQLSYNRVFVGAF